MIRMSAQTDELFAALAKAQGEIEDPIKGKTNPHFKSKYVPLEAAREAAQAVLAKHGLYVGQMPATDDAGRVTLTTIIGHASGQWMSSDFPLPLPTNATAQQFGSAMTYSRRYSFMAALGLAGEPDEDGNAASAKPAAPAPQRQEHATPAALDPAPSATLSKALARLRTFRTVDDYEAFVGQANVDKALSALPPAEKAEWSKAVLQFKANVETPSDLLMAG